MHLESGYYRIYNGDNLVGRAALEDGTCLPKTVYNATNDPESIWQIDSLSDGMYILRNFDAPVVAIGGYLKAIVYPNTNENVKNFEWFVASRDYQGKDLYTIATSAGDGFWHTTGDTPLSPIAVGPVIVNPTNPPLFTKGSLFRLEPVTLQSGIYTIHNGVNAVGRSPVEDRSYNPKAIFNATVEARSLWHITVESNGKYKLRNLGAPVAEERDLLFAFIQPGVDQTDPKFDWNIEPQFHQGRFLYTITRPDNSGWFTTSDKFSQIEVGPLGFRKIEPPEYFTNALFRIVPFVIKSGFYTISNSDDLVGRASIENESLDPKPVLNKTDNPDATWYIQATGPSRYKLSASRGFGVVPPESATSDKFLGYNPVGVEEQQTQNTSVVSAFLDPKFVAPEWIIIPRFNHGENMYTIQIPSPILLERSWFAHVGKEMSQIEIRGVLLSDPIPPNLLFKINPLPIPISKQTL